MRKIIAILAVCMLVFSLTGAQAEKTDTEFLVSDWKLTYSFGGATIAEQTVFLYDDNTFEIMDEDEKKKGSWSFEGDILTLSLDGVDMELKWDREANQLTGVYNGMDISMIRPIEPENGDSAPGAPETGMLAGGWSVAEDPAITDDIKNVFYQSLDSYQTGTITVAYTPVALLGTQVVAGTNFALLCRSQEINKEPVLVILYIYRYLEGNASVIKEESLNLGI